MFNPFMSCYILKPKPMKTEEYQKECWEALKQAIRTFCNPVIKSVCDHNWKEWEDESCNAQMRCTKCKTVKQNES